MREIELNKRKKLDLGDLNHICSLSKKKKVRVLPPRLLRRRGRHPLRLVRAGLVAREVPRARVGSLERRRGRSGLLRDAPRRPCGRGVPVPERDPAPGPAGDGGPLPCDDQGAACGNRGPPGGSPVHDNGEEEQVGKEIGKRGRRRRGRRRRPVARHLARVPPHALLVPLVRRHALAPRPRRRRRGL